MIILKFFIEIFKEKKKKKRVQDSNVNNLVKSLSV